MPDSTLSPCVRLLPSWCALVLPLACCRQQSPQIFFWGGGGGGGQGWRGEGAVEGRQGLHPMALISYLSGRPFGKRTVCLYAAPSSEASCVQLPYLSYTYHTGHV